MKTKIALALLAFGAASFANAGTKIFEFNDPSTGNTPSSCSLTQTYQTGFGSTIYTAYTVSCPGDTVQMGIEESQSWPYNCTFNTYTSGYYISGNCNNWRLYKN